MIDAPPPAANDPPSPCTKVCSLDRHTGWCLGCYRTGAEIGAWPTMSPQARRDLLAELAGRQQAGFGRRGKGGR